MIKLRMDGGKKPQCVKEDIVQRHQSHLMVLNTFSHQLSISSSGLYIIGGGDDLHDPDPASVDMIETFSDNFNRGPEPLLMRQTVGSASVSVFDSIFLLGGWSQITKHYIKDVLVLYPHNKDNWKKIGELQRHHYGFG